MDIPADHPADDLGTPLVRTGVARRVVSLVPSITEAIAVTRPEALVGATDWCTHPAGLDVARVRGTKNPDRAAVAALRPDLVVANKEENRRLDVERLRAAGVPVWVTDIETVPQALESLGRLFTLALRWGEPDWLAACRTQWAGPPGPVRLRAAIAVWRDPWLVVGRDTFTGDLARRLGIENVFAGAGERYPRVTLQDIAAHRPDAVLLPDEPYVFTADDGPECFPDTRPVLVSGRALTWYGPSLLTARETLLRALDVH